MKSSIYTSSIAMAIVALLAVSCAKDPKAKLEELKKEQAELAAEIKTIEEQLAKSNTNAPVALKAKEVSISQVSPKSFDYYVKTQGRVEAEQNVMVSSKSMGVITQVFVKEGDQISKGKVIAQIDNSVIVRNIEALNTQLELANTVFERQRRLWEQKIGTEVQYLQAKTGKENLEKQIEALKEQNEMTRITSPINGTVDEVTVKVGENIAPGMPAARVVNSSELKLVANVSEAYVTELRVGDKVVVSIPQLDKEINGRLSFVGKTIDPLSRTFTVEVDLPSLPELRANMTATIKIVFRTESAAIVVPVNVIQNINNEKVVYVVDGDGDKAVARKKVVSVSGVYEDQAEVKGLSAGEKIITVGYQGLNDGQRIKI